MTPLGQQSFLPGMRDIVAEMREVGPVGSDQPGSLDGLLKVHMRRMRCVAERVQYQNPDSPRRFQSGIGQSGAVGEIGEQFPPAAMQDKARRRELSMRQIHRHDCCLPQLERTINPAGIKPEIVLPGLGRIEGVAETMPQLIHRLRRGVNWHLAILHLAEAAHIVESHDVIRMGMGEEGGVEALDPFAERLHAELRGRVDDEVNIRGPDQHRSACPAIPGVLRATDAAVATDDGNALRSACSEKGEIK